jgi:peptidyl-prolyl cis-trans isomerase C
MYARLRSLARKAAPGFFMPPGGGGARRMAWALGLMLSLWALSGCSARPAVALAARVNGEPITVDQWQEEQRFLGGPAADGAEALNGLIDQALTLQEGRRLGLRFDDADRAKALALAMDGVDAEVLDASLKDLGLTQAQWRDRVVRCAEAAAVVDAAVAGKLQASDQEVRDRYWEHLLLYRKSSRRVLRQIFTRTRPAAEGAMRELEMGEPFAGVASEEGQGPEAASAGLLGALTRDQLPKSLSRAAWALKPGTYSPIVASHWGYHILYLESLLPSDAGTLEEAAPAARADLLLDKEQASYRAWLARLREAAVIEHFAVLEPLKTETVQPEKGMP